MKKIENLKQEIEKEFKDLNFRDSQHIIEKAKKKYPEKELISFLRKEIAIRKKIDSMRESEIEKVKQRYPYQRVSDWEQALSYVTHKYNCGEHIFVYFDGISCGRIESKTKKGYKVFIGRKLGIVPEIQFKDVICHVSNRDKILEVLREDDGLRK